MVSSKKLQRLRTPVLVRNLAGLGLGALILAVSPHVDASSDAATVAASARKAPARRVPAPMPSLAPVIAKVQPAVVSIRAFGSAGAMGAGMAQGIGSGFILSADGVVVTNHHVVAGADSFEVRLKDGRRFRAQLRGSDRLTDLAVLDLEDAKDLPTLRLGSSESLQVGDYVIAIGSPLGLESTVTSGIVSAKGRGDLGLYRDSYLDFVQTDAAISRGSSGGPLVDLEGRVVGVNTAVAGPGNGLGFSIPIDQAKVIIPQLRDQGTVARGWLGVAGRDVQPALGGVEPVDGAVVGEVVEGSPAAVAGLEKGDLIVGVNAHSVDSFADLRGRVAMMPPSTQVTLKVRRDGATKKIRVRLGDLERERQAMRSPRQDRPRGSSPGRLYDGRPSLGVAVTNTPEGLEVRSVEPRSVAARLELRPGDVLLEINGQAIEKVADVRAALGRDASTVQVKVRRDGGTHMSMIQIRR